MIKHLSTSGIAQLHHNVFFMLFLWLINILFRTLIHILLNMRKFIVCHIFISDYTIVKMSWDWFFFPSCLIVKCYYFHKFFSLTLKV